MSHNHSSGAAGVNPAQPHQFEFALPPPQTADIIEETLRGAVCDFNECTDPAERSELLLRVRRLRDLLGVAGKR